MDRNRMRAGIAILTAVSLLPAPLLAQDAKGSDASSQLPQAPTLPPPMQVSLSSPFRPRKVDATLDKFFPDVAGPYTSRRIAEPTLSNSPRIEQLMQNEKLILSLQDAISL